MKGFLKSKKTILFLSMLLACLVLFGCSDNADKPDPDSSSTIKIGVLGPFTGPSARTGEELRGAVTLAFDNIDNKIGDYDIEFQWIDDEADAEKGARAYEAAIVRDNITIGFGNWNSPVSVSCMEVAAKYKIPHFFAFGATDIVNDKYQSDPDKYYYWMGKGWPIASKITVGYVNALNEAIDKGIWEPRNKNVAVFGLDYDFDRDFGEAIKDQFEKMGWKVVTSEWVSRGETDFYPLINKLKKLDVSVIAGTMGEPAPVTSFIKQVGEIGLDSVIICDGLGWVGEWYEITGDSSNLILDQIPQWTTPESIKFKEDFTDKFGFEPSASAAGQYYDFSNYLIKILEQCLADYGEINTENMAKIGKEKVMTGEITYDEGIIHSELRYTSESFPDPVVGEDAYIFPVIQYYDGLGKIVWPDAWKETDMVVRTDK